ncbi:cytosol aminopeptidase isoform X2 [Halyomorpha halys]|nr:cytosol aminopeptidase-like isoform X2 [Halyomorpha halys]
MGLGKVKVFNNLGTDYYGVAIAGTGPDTAGYNENETLDECKENIRISSAVGAQALQDVGCKEILVDGYTNAEAAAEGSSLGVWRYQDLKSRDRHLTEPNLSLFDDPDADGWQSGLWKADAQNIVRKLEETPANLMFPSAFAEAAIDILCPCGVHVEVRDKDWLTDKNMTAFLAMSRSSCNPAMLLECSYCGGGETDKPVILTGKGVTFDSGGFCLKPHKGFEEHRADMAGAAVIVGVLKAMARLQVPMNVNALIPLMENMPGNMAMKPGDVIVSLNGKTIRIENTDHEGRVILADCLTLSNQYNPCLVVNIATLTAAVRAALGSSASAAFSTSEVVWRELSRAGAETGDRVWRFPAWKMFTTKVTDWVGVDVHNVGAGRGGDPCLGAAFLLEFAPPVDFLHLDITGTGMLASGACGNAPYYRKGSMTGRPTRALLQFLMQMACPLDRPTTC